MLLKPYERLNIINAIALKLQADLKTIEINLLLGSYGVEPDEVNVVASKRQYVMELLKSKPDALLIKIALDLNLGIQNKSLTIVEDFVNLLESNQLSSVVDDFNRASKNLEHDPEIAITSASSTLESICKAVCDFFKEPYPASESMQSLVYKTCKLLYLSPDQHADEQIKKILGGLNSVATGIGSLRTKNSAAHGHGTKKCKLSLRHSRLVVNSCATVGLFILETYYEKYLIEQ